MKNRPLLILAIAAVFIAWSLYQSLGGLDGVRREPGQALGVTAIAILIIVPLFWFRYRRMKREPIYVEVQDRAQGAPLDPRLGATPIVLAASRTKMLAPLIMAILSAGLIVFLMWRQPGLCRVAGLAALAPFLALSLIVVLPGLLKPERLEITPQGLKHVTFWRAHFWPWDEIRNITVIKGRAFGLVWSSGVCFNRYAAQASAPGLARPMLKPIWPMRADDLAALLNDARERWSSGLGSALVPVRKRLAEHLPLALAWVGVGVMLWLLLGRPCGL